MIIIKIMGGLGNQLFTYAFGYSQSKKNSTNLCLDLMIYHTTYTLRNFMLDDFNIDFTSRLLKKGFGRGKTIKVYKFLHNAKLKILNAKDIDEKEEFAKQEFEEKKGNIYYRGYWQNYRYFDEYRQDIIRQFSLKKPSEKLKILFDRALKEKPIALHIRRTDYKNFKGGKCLSINYYKESIKMMKKRYSDNVPIWIFTDDLTFCNESFKDEKNIVYVSEEFALSDIEEFVLMSKCTGFVIANSTFSWWAAYLASNNTDQYVIAPVVDFWKKDFYLDEWTTIEASLE